jgi:hypothetical protein
MTFFLSMIPAVLSIFLSKYLGLESFSNPDMIVFAAIMVVYVVGYITGYAQRRQY